VPFHVEISSGFRQRARAFNLDQAKLRTAILQPWVHNRLIRLGEKDWEPRESSLIILEGPELESTDLAMGRGWSNAEKNSENVTRRLVDEAAGASIRPLVAVLAEQGSRRAEVEQTLARLGLRTAPWRELRAQILGARPRDGGPGYAAVLVVDGQPSAAWYFDAGLARGALGGRAVIAQVGSAPIPAELSGVDLMRFDVEDEVSVEALADRLVK
jgi:hypothetical protein